MHRPHLTTNFDEYGIIPHSLGQHFPTPEQPVFELETTVVRELRAERFVVSCTLGRVDLLELTVLGTDLFNGHTLPGEAFGIGAFGTRFSLDPWKPGERIVLTVRWTPPHRIQSVWNHPRKYRGGWYVTQTRPYFAALALCRVPP